MARSITGSMRTRSFVLEAVIAAAAGLGGTAAADPIAQPAQPKLGPELAARIPAGGALIALRGEGLSVVRLTGRGPVELYRDRAFSPQAVMWTDRTTLVALGDSDGNLELRWIIDGKLDPSRTVQVREDGIQGPLTMHAGRAGAVWIEACFEHVDTGDERGSVCSRTRWMRADTAPRTFTARAPSLPRPRPGFGALPKRQAPAGYRAKLTPPRYKRADGERFRGIECAQPSAKVTWEKLLNQYYDTLSPARLQWISQTPPLLAVEGVATNVVGWPRRAVWLFTPCDSTPLLATWIGDNLWARRDSVETDLWTVYLDDQPVAVLHASDELVPGPRSGS